MRIEPGQGAVSRDIAPLPPAPGPGRGGAALPAVRSAAPTAPRELVPTRSQAALLDVGQAMDRVVSTLDALGGVTAAQAQPAAAQPQDQLPAGAQEAAAAAASPEGQAAAPTSDDAGSEAAASGGMGGRGGGGRCGMGGMGGGGMGG